MDATSLVFWGRRRCFSIVIRGQVACVFYDLWVIIPPTIYLYKLGCH